MDYKGLAFRIRRRQANGPETRNELSVLASSLHERLDFHVAWTILERPSVGIAYAQLVQIVRNESGTYCDAAWDAPPVDDDSGMTMSLGNVFRYENTAAAAEDCLNEMLRDLRRPFWSYLRPSSATATGLYACGVEPPTPNE